MNAIAAETRIAEVEAALASERATLAAERAALSADRERPRRSPRSAISCVRLTSGYFELELLERRIFVPAPEQVAAD